MSQNDLKNQVNKTADKAADKADKAADQTHKATEDVSKKADKTAKNAADKAEKTTQDMSEKAKKAASNLSKDADKAAQQAGEQAEHFIDDAKAAANKVGDYISKEAEDLQDKANEASKKYVAHLTSSLSKGLHDGLDRAKTYWEEFSSHPKYWLTTLSAVNVAVLGAAGYFGYQNRNQIKAQDQRLLGAVAVGIVTFLGGERGRLNLHAVPLGLGAIALQASLYDVPGGYRAVLFDRFTGVKKTPENSGTHFLIPWVQRAILYDVRIKPRTISTTTGSKDLQMVTLSLRVLSRPDVANLPQIYQSLGTDYDERVLPSIGNEVLKAIVAQFDAAELITQREVVSARIREDLLARAQEFNIVLEDVSITHLTFGQEFTKAVEQKQIAQQDAERAKFVVEKAEQERQASVVRAEGEAEAASLITRALDKAGDSLLTMRRIEASQDIAKTLSNARNVTYLPHGNNVLLGMNQNP
ncbi:Prohibitin-1, subunit of the prohibitin complex (Phb1p-Phb2p) [Malassezia psittaci]|uniref:Prohibitin-1, subunit of the prohibitin complex (Phb1p-Phb2p) n=1 Tax=Malassezia psittaci TaxID=1821823 RepID=A0AAF0F462_9BASI|nr:Prohibitin-1, subunit of the prohibitin complex (Phb1p-Phb2p) [Malassezia psittaci]